MFIIQENEKGLKRMAFEFTKANVAEKLKKIMALLETGDTGEARGRLEYLLEGVEGKVGRGGRKCKSLKKEDYDEIIRLIDSGYGYRGVAEKFKVSVGTAHKIYQEWQPSFIIQENKQKEEQVTLA